MALEAMTEPKPSIEGAPAQGGGAAAGRRSPGTIIGAFRAAARGPVAQAQMRRRQVAGAPSWAAQPGQRQWEQPGRGGADYVRRIGGNVDQYNASHERMRQLTQGLRNPGPSQPGPPQFGQMPGLPQPPQMPQMPPMPGPAQPGPEEMGMQTGGPEPRPEMKPPMPPMPTRPGQYGGINPGGGARPGGGSVFGNPWGGFGG